MNKPLMKTLLASMILLLSTNLITAQEKKDSVTLILQNLSTENTKDTVGAFRKVEIEAQYLGGIKSWQKYLTTNLNPDAPLKDLRRKVKHFEQTVWVQFIVCTDGTVCDVQVINDVLPSIKKEAIRVIS
jgi:periplasmic protein TonB